MRICTGIGISIISLNSYSSKPWQTKYQKKEGSRPSLALSKARVGFADRAVEGGIPKESAKPYFPLKYLVGGKGVAGVIPAF